MMDPTQIKTIEELNADKKPQTNDDVPMFGAHYKAMDRKQRRSYKRWLTKNKYWDGAEVLERLQS